MRTILVASLLMLLPLAAHAQTVKLYAAGSLKTALTEVAKNFEAENPNGPKIEAAFGASGLLREKIEAGETAHVFASADTGHPKKLANQGLTAAPVQVFARNQLCAIARQGLDVTAQTLLDVMADPKVRLGISTPKADPSGDYALALFAKAAALKPGVEAVLEAKALQLTGGPNSPKPPQGRNTYGWVMAEGQADMFLTYCTNAVLAKAEVPALVIVEIPQAINVAADYGLVVLKDAPQEAAAFASYIRSPAGQATLAKYGFGAGD